MDFPALFSSAEMGHQLQLVGVTLLGVAMTASERAGEDGERAALAQHHMGSCQPITPGAAPAPARPGPARVGSAGSRQELPGLGEGSWRGSHGNGRASLQERTQQPRLLLLPARQSGPAPTPAAP